MLKENRAVQHMKERWWIEKNFQVINGEQVNCAKENEQSSLDTPDLDIEHILGAYLVLIIGIGLGLLIGVCEFLWNVRKVSIAQKVIRIHAIQLILQCLINLIATCVFSIFRSHHTRRFVENYYLHARFGLPKNQS